MVNIQLVQMFGELVMFGGTHQEDIDTDYRDFNSFDKRFFWNDIGCELNIKQEDYPKLTPRIVEELCACFILDKIGKSIEVQLT